MPHIITMGVDTTKQVQVISVHADITYSTDFKGTPRQHEFQQQLQAEIETLVHKYFGEIETNDYTDTEWNSIIDNQ